MEGVKYEGEMGRHRAKGGGPVPAASLTSGMSSCTCACQRKNKHEENEASERQDMQRVMQKPAEHYTIKNIQMIALSLSFLY